MSAMHELAQSTLNPMTIKSLTLPYCAYGDSAPLCEINDYFRFPLFMEHQPTSAIPHLNSNRPSPLRVADLR